MSDTNLKKSWHPHAAKSRARLERAEQAHQEEQRKIQEWRREQEIAEENAQLKRSAENAGLKADRPERLDWMYEHSGVDSQEKETVENYSPSYKKSASLAKQSAKDSNKPSTDLLLGHKSLDKAAISSISQADPSSKVADDPAEDRRQQRLALEDPMALMMQAPSTKRVHTSISLSHRSNVRDHMVHPRSQRATGRQHVDQHDACHREPRTSHKDHKRHPTPPRGRFRSKDDHRHRERQISERSHGGKAREHRRRRRYRDGYRSRSRSRERSPRDRT